MKKSIQLNQNDYTEICALLEIDSSKDVEVTNYLAKRINWLKSRITAKVLKQRIIGKQALVFGAGPTLTQTIEKIKDSIAVFRENLVIIAADGALLALQEKDIFVDIVVTDLDGSLGAIRRSLEQKTIVVLHAHGDNLTKIQQIEDIIPTLGILGSTQIPSTKKIENFGGFTDGDRAAYLAANFQAQSIILLAFDFGSIVGRYSKPENHSDDFLAPITKELKFSIAKRLLREMPKLFPKIACYNATIQGEPLDNWEIVPIDKLSKILKN